MNLTEINLVQFFIIPQKPLKKRIRELKKTGLAAIISEEDGQKTINGNFSDGSFVFGRTVVLSPFEIGKYEVTQEFFNEIMGFNPSCCTSDTDDENVNLKPVDSANLYQVIAFCNKLSVICGLEPVYTGEVSTQKPYRRILANEVLEYVEQIVKDRK